MAVTVPDSAAAAPGSPALPAPADVEPVRPWSPPRGTTVLAMLLVLAAEGMVLGALVSAYFTIKAGAPLWPPSGVNINTYIPTVVSITAVMAGCSVGWMLFAMRRNDQRNAFSAAALTVVLGFAMANGQWYSITRAGFGVGKHAYGTLFYLLMGLHLLHLVIGIVMLMVVAGQTLAGHYDNDDHEPVRATAYFWQFGNVVWLVIVCALFLFSPHAQ